MIDPKAPRTLVDAFDILARLTNRDIEYQYIDQTNETLDESYERLRKIDEAARAVADAAKLAANAKHSPFRYTRGDGYEPCMCVVHENERRALDDYDSVRRLAS